MKSSKTTPKKRNRTEITEPAKKYVDNNLTNNDEHNEPNVGDAEKKISLKKARTSSTTNMNESPKAKYNLRNKSIKSDVEISVHKSSNPDEFKPANKSTSPNSSHKINKINNLKNDDALALLNTKALTSSYAPPISIPLSIQPTLTNSNHNTLISNSVNNERYVGCATKDKNDISDSPKNYSFAIDPVKSVLSTTSNMQEQDHENYKHSNDLKKSRTINDANFSMEDSQDETYEKKRGINDNSENLAHDDTLLNLSKFNQSNEKMNGITAYIQKTTIIALCLLLMILLSARLFMLSPRIFNPFNRPAKNLKTIFQGKSVCWGINNSLSSKSCKIWKPCPKKALCVGGNIFLCPSLFEKSENGCTPGVKMTDYIQKAEILLADKFIKYICEKAPYPSLPLPDVSSPGTAQALTEYLLNGEFAEIFKTDFKTLRFELSDQTKAHIYLPLKCMLKPSAYQCFWLQPYKTLIWFSCLIYLAYILRNRGKNYRRHVLWVRASNFAYEYLIDQAQITGKNKIPVSKVQVHVLKQLCTPGSPYFSKAEFVHYIWPKVTHVFQNDPRILRLCKENEVPCWSWLPNDPIKETVPHRLEPKSPIFMIGSKI